MSDTTHTSKKELFIRLASPDENGVSRWVRTAEFVGEYSTLRLGNGGSWCRANSSLARRYNIEVDKSITAGNTIDAVRLNGFNTTRKFNQTIRQDIRGHYRTKKCVMLGVAGFSENTKIEIDHKNGRKNDSRVSDPATQRSEDFQPLCKAANDAKRQICKVCRQTGKRWDARNIEGNPYPYYLGDENYTEELGCKGCYQYDPVAYRKESARKLIAESAGHTVEYMMRKLYPDTIASDK